MNWKTFLGVTVLLVVVIVSLWTIFSGDSAEEVDYEKDRELQESSPKRVDTSQEKLVNLANSSGKQKARLQEVRYSSFTDSFSLESKRNKLNIGDLVVDIFKEKVFEEFMPNFLKKGSLRISAGKIILFEQKIIFPESLELEEFEDEDFLDGGPYIGFNLEKGDEVLGYSLVFIDPVTWEELPGSFITFMGRDYYVKSVDRYRPEIELWEEPYKLKILEGEILDFIHPTIGLLRIKIDYIDQNEIRLNLDGEVLETLNIDEFYELEDLRIYVEDISYSLNSIGQVELIISPRKMTLYSSILWDEQDQKVDSLEFEVDTYNEDYVRSIDLSWIANESIVITEYNSPEIPYFKNLIYKMTNRGYDAEDAYYSVFNLSGTSYILEEI